MCLYIYFQKVTPLVVKDIIDRGVRDALVTREVDRIWPELLFEFVQETLSEISTFCNNS